jgi:hypothetical protein
MSEDFQFELNQLNARLVRIERAQQDSKDRLAEIESVHRAAKVAILDRQAQLVDVARRLTNLDCLSSELRLDLSVEKSQCSEIRSSLAEAKSWLLEL